MELKRNISYNTKCPNKLNDITSRRSVSRLLRSEIMCCGKTGRWMHQYFLAAHNQILEIAPVSIRHVPVNEYGIVGVGKEGNRCEYLEHSAQLMMINVTYECKQIGQCDGGSVFNAGDDAYEADEWRDQEQNGSKTRHKEVLNWMNKRWMSVCF